MSQKQSSQLNRVASVPPEITSAIQQSLGQKSADFAKGLRITLSPPPPLKADQKLTAGLNKSTTGHSLKLEDVLTGPQLALLRNLLGIPDLTLLPINIAIAWTINNGELTGRLLPSQQQARTLNGSTAPTFVLAFLPQLIEQTKTSSSAVQLNIAVKLTISTQVGDQTFTAPPINLSLPILLPTLPIPTLLGLFRHPSFAVKDGNKQGFLLLVVPTDSPFNVKGEKDQDLIPDLIKEELATLRETAATLDRALGLVSTIAGFVLPSGLTKLVEALRIIGGFAVNGINVTTDNPLDNLNQIDMIDHPFFFKFNDIEADNETSSLILMGANNTKAELFRRKERKTSGGQLNVTTGPALVTLISNLHRREPIAVPDADEAVVPDSSAVDWELWSNKHFGDSISSLKVTF